MILSGPSDLRVLLRVLCVKPGLDNYSISLNAEFAEADAEIAEKKHGENF